jgi:autotransporter adhesin
MTMIGIPYATRAALTAGIFMLGLAATPAMAGCNSGDTGTLLTSASCQATTNTSFDTAVGASAAARNGSTALGLQASAKGFISTALGRQATANEDGAVAIGHWAGFGLGGIGQFSTAIGAGTSGLTSARAGGTMAIAIGGGDSSDFTPTGGTLMHLDGAAAPGLFGVAIGVASKASGGGSMAIGPGSKATANDSTAFGEFSEASGDGSVAVGLFSQSSGRFALAFGRSARATKPFSVALGYNSLANELNVVSVGSPNARRRIVTVATGVNPNDAVNLAQLQAAMRVAARTASQAGGGDDLRQELADLRAIVQQQQREIAELKAASRLAAR